ncbi:hypothetical protein N658DRAFT_560934 [Parathielavia hyrcaniae]|uniref:Uncharacterized protein n=1 Tax=Parathielavia hyrcaniae TaxID=113614 RepID=A0AAN6SYQ6_9PEZI|nr:hypothetical protein N658DRAFT_560934 [Parathielavia hyrcaniae]
MRLLKAIIAFAALAAALPSERAAAVSEIKAREADPESEPAADNSKSAIDVKVYNRSPDVEPDSPVLDARIAAQEKEDRTVNLSPRNNPRDGLLPRQCRGSRYCPCSSYARPGLWCGYCTRPVDAIYKCTSGACLNEVFQCGGGGACCSYGYRNSCANRRGPCGG